MQDVELPRLTAYVSPSPSHYSGEPHVQYYAQPSSGPVAQHSSSGVYYLPSSTPASDLPESLGSPQPELPSRALTLVALKSESIYPVRDYWGAGRLLFYVMPDGSEASTYLDRIDWQRTADLNSERGVRVTLRTNPTKF
jgi:hypothetical protein